MSTTVSAGALAFAVAWSLWLVLVASAARRASARLTP